MGPLCAGLLLALGTPGGTMTLGVVNGSATPLSTPWDVSTYLLLLALAVTAVIAAVAIYFVTRRQRRALLVEGEPTTPLRTR